jgi:hypothetical protein
VNRPTNPVDYLHSTLSLRPEQRPRIPPHLPSQHFRIRARPARLPYRYARARPRRGHHPGRTEPVTRSPWSRRRVFGEDDRDPEGDRSVIERRCVSWRRQSSISYRELTWPELPSHVLADADLAAAYLTAKATATPRKTADHEELELLLENYSQRFEGIITGVSGALVSPSPDPDSMLSSYIAL